MQNKTYSEIAEQWAREQGRVLVSWVFKKGQAAWADDFLSITTKKDGVRFRNNVTLTEEYKPHDYQLEAMDFLEEKPHAALFADPGLGKTAIVKEPEFKTRTIRRGCKLYRRVLTEMKTATFYTLDNGFSGEQAQDIEHTRAYGRKELAGDFGRLPRITQNGPNEYRIHYHSNHWTDVTL